MSIEQLTADLKERARYLGFELAGVCPAVEPLGLSRFHEWLQAGYAGEMRYLEERQDAYASPNSILDGARSIVMLAMNYRTADPHSPTTGEGRVSRYAWGESDYHDVIHSKLKQLVAWLSERAPNARSRGVVDTAPLLEREFAQLSGLGWIGKNTLLLNQTFGSWFFLAALLTDETLAYDDPFETDHCGTCRACLDACPTGAFPQPYVLDATRCISYLTIELRDGIPKELRSGVGDWLFGCDVCQDVCPWNHRVPLADEAFEPRSDQNPISLAPLFFMTDEEFRKRFRQTPLWRSKRRGTLRNAAIVLGNQRHAAALPALARGLEDDEPLVRGACVWALGKINTTAAVQALTHQLEREDSEQVKQELREALVQS
jgi:epoxyqueuosine reductase